MIRHRTGTLSGSAQNLLALLFPAAPTAANDFACTYIALQADPAAAAAIFVGEEGVTTTDYGVRIPIPATSVPAAPFAIGPSAGEAPVKLSSIYVVGTAADKLHVLFVVR
jgi:hypothetical protein